jgi:hypothetical protein
MFSPGIKYCLSLSILMWLFTGILVGQHEMALGISPGTDISEEVQTYYDSLFQTSNYQINGTLNQGKYKTGKGHPYFGEMNWRPGILYVENHNISNPAVRYDLLNDCLLSQNFTLAGSHVININKEIVRSFRLDGHTFRFLDVFQDENSGMEAGYYESAFRSESEIWVKREKYFAESSQGGGEYVYKNTIYIKGGDTWHKITNKKSLLKAFPGRENDLKSYIKKFGVVVRHGNVDQLVELVKYIENQ